MLKFPKLKNLTSEEKLHRVALDNLYVMLLSQGFKLEIQKKRWVY